MTRLIDKLLGALRDAAIYNPDVQVPPECILWTDGDRQWEAVITRLQADLPELFVLGDYQPERKSGPAIWLRCVIARKLSDQFIPHDRTIILYLPGVSRQDLRAVESCPEPLKPLSQLQYSGVIWSQISNSKDWTILAFLKSTQGGLGLDIAQDNDTKASMQLALYRLLDEDVALLQGKHLDRDYFNTLLTGGDPVRDLLQWIDQGDVFKDQLGVNEWQAFIAVCKSQLGFNPQDEGVLAGAMKLARHEGPWNPIWERFCEAPRRYPNIPGLIRRCPPPNDKLFWQLSDGKFSGWPQWNEDQESALRKDLLGLASVAPHEARAQLQEFEKRHGSRRKLVWAELGEAPLAFAIEQLAVLASITLNGLCAGTAEDLAAVYAGSGWRADDAVVKALACIEKAEDAKAVFAAIRAVYLPWCEDCARHLQKVVEHDGYPGGSITAAKKVQRVDRECVMFVDGLRFDLAKRLAELLVSSGCNVLERPVWSALPSVTATGKPAVSPVREKLRGLEVNSDFEPIVAEGGQSLKGGYQIKKLLAEAGWDILERSSHGNGRGNAWCEFGDIDSEGHDRGWKLAKHIDLLLREIQDRILHLLKTGDWKSVRIVTDHGWLLMPGGLPKIELPTALSDNKWGRCAAIKPGAKTQERLYPWFWNTNQQFALADGISCFRKGEEYAHGGLSLQECFNLELNVSLSTVTTMRNAVEITDIKWKGLRCTVAVDGDFEGLSVDIRSHAGNPSSSLVVSVKPLKENGTASVVVEDEDVQGTDAFVVVCLLDGGLIAQSSTKVGGGLQKAEEMA